MLARQRGKGGKDACLLYTSLLQLWETQQAMRDKPISRYEALRMLREQAALYNLLAANGITTMEQLHEKVNAMNAQYMNCEVKLYPLNVELRRWKNGWTCLKNKRKTKRCSVSMSK